jgi:CheY-like chemotaxis protein
VVFLPILADEPSTLIPPPKTSNQSDGTAPKRILVTDDNQDAAKSLSMLLRLNGHEVETVFDGESAVAKAETYRPDIMLLDIGLPDMNGYDVCRTIRQTPWGKSIRMVALTGWGQEQDRRNAREAGFDDHLVKPVDPQVLRRAVSASSS